MSKNVRDLGKLIVSKALKSCPKSNKSPNLVTLLVSGEVVFVLDVLVQQFLTFVL